jgi:hypothetical protein
LFPFSTTLNFSLSSGKLGLGGNVTQHFTYELVGILKEEKKVDVLTLHILTFDVAGGI